MFRLNILCKLDVGGKCLSIRVRKLRPIFDRTFLLNGGLYQIMFLRLFRWLFGLFAEASSSGSYLSLALKLLRLRASYNGAAAPKERRSEDRVEMRLLMVLGGCLVMEGGWLDWLCMNRGSSFGLR